MPPFFRFILIIAFMPFTAGQATSEPLKRCEYYIRNRYTSAPQKCRVEKSMNNLKITSYSMDNKATIHQWLRIAPNTFKDKQNNLTWKESRRIGMTVYESSKQCSSFCIAYDFVIWD